MLRLAPITGYLVLLGPVLCGVLATLLPAFGYFPALGGDSFNLDAFHVLFAKPGIFQSSMISLFVGLGTSLVSLALVMFFIAGWANTRLFKFIETVLSPLLSVPHAAAAFGLAFLIAPSGWLIRLVSPHFTGITTPPDLLIVHDPLALSMMLGLIIKEIPFLFLVCLAALPQTRPRRNMQLAASLGYGRTSGFLLCVWPQLYPRIRLAVFAVIVYASSVVDVALILGPTNPAPLAVRLLGWMSDPDLAMRFAASAGAVLQFAISTLALGIWMMLELLGNKMCKLAARRGARMRKDRLMRATSAFAIFCSAALIAVGLLILAIWSVSAYWKFPDAMPTGFSLANWQRQADMLARPIAITLSVGLLSTLIAAIIVVGALEHEERKKPQKSALATNGNNKQNQDKALIFLYLPLLIPQASFVFGLNLFFLMIGLDTLFFSLIIVHLVFVLPYVFLSFSDTWRAFDRRYIQIAQVMGKSRNRIFWKIRLPMLLRPLLVASAVGFAVSVAQYLPTVLIGAGRWPTITTEAVALSSGGDRRIIGIYAFIQMALPFIGFLLSSIVSWAAFWKYKDMRASW